ncbi:MAG TPA: hypothetical protein PK024_09870 [Methanospirillum sp.]|uniref:hypothetical protein n=1 Tax=Methanospirillum sp. TaxID=45200 RepID=UPI002C1CEE88|nr:hypothetical protein [Methanospirillum sp.]HOJ97126.1 hypothetical protein [Methanospirillum sp.]HPP77027.1 hypothetical protein [Methanospirillum sp.]
MTDPPERCLAGMGPDTSAIAHPDGMQSWFPENMIPGDDTGIPLQLLQRIGTEVPSGLHTWITYQTHQPHQTAQGSRINPPASCIPFHRA